MKKEIIYKRFPEHDYSVSTPMDNYKHGHFEAKGDSTDHLWFECESCGKKAILELVMVDREPEPEFGPVMHFFLGCPYCNIAGQRKIYAKDYMDKSHKM